MINVLLLAPLYGNGGIASWTKKYLQQFPNKEFNLIPVSVVGSVKNPNANIIERTFKGITELKGVIDNIKSKIKDSNIDILHTTTSGSLGSFRDYIVGKLCKRHKIKCVMHCRYGCIPSIISKSGLQKKLLIKSMSVFDQIWVLDRHSFDILQQEPQLKDKVFITPNSIQVNEIERIPRKDFNNFIFLANVVPTKGIFELIKAFKSITNSNSKLHIIGPADNKIIKEMEKVSGDFWNRSILYYGPKSNTEAVEFLKKMDCMILPTYYEGEAFPISILEAMSLGKLIISTNRAAIPDMLTNVDGTKCGILVEEKNIDQISNAIEWIHNNKDEANKLCELAYKKVFDSYRNEVVYEIYRSNYKKLLNDGKF